MSQGGAETVLQDRLRASVEIEGADEAANALRNLGAVGAEAFAHIIDAASKGDFTGLATMVGGELAGSFVKATEAVFSFVEAQAHAVEELQNLASATGMTLPQIEGMKDAFASAGISTSGFERSIQRLAIVVGNSWTGIEHSVRTASETQGHAMTEMTQATLNVEKAHHALESSMTSVSQTAARNAEAIESAALTLKRAENALRDSALASRQNSNSLEGATLSLAQAKMNLAKDSGQSVSKEEEQALKIAQDKLAVKNAEVQVQEAQNKKLDEGIRRETDALNLKKARREAQEAETKAIEDSIKGMDTLKQAQLNLAKAREADRAAAQKMHETDLKDIPKIAQEIEKVVQGTKKWDEVINHTEISAQNLTKAIILAASTGGPPKAGEVFEELSKLFVNMGDSADAMNKKMQIVQQTMGAGFRSGQASASQLLAILERGPEALKKFQEESDKFSKSGIGISPHDVEALKEFNAAWASLGAVVDQVKGHFAAIIASGLTRFLNAMKESLADNNGLLHTLAEVMGAFLQGIVAIGQAIGAIIGVIGQAVDAIAKMFNIEPGTVWKAMLVAIHIAIGGIPTAIILVVAAIGTIISKWDDVKKAFSDLLTWFEGTFVGKIISGISKIIAKIVEWIAKLGKAKGDTAAAAPPAAANDNGGGGEAEAAEGKAGGGHIRGPGGPTDDKAGLFALSDNEYVVRSAAVSHYGAPLFEALNNLAVGGFAMGGLVGGVVGPRATDNATGPSSTLNLTIDGNHFDGLRAPEHVASKLKTYAVTRQTASAGRRPSWAS